MTTLSTSVVCVASQANERHVVAAHKTQKRKVGYNRVEFHDIISEIARSKCPSAVGKIITFTAVAGYFSVMPTVEIIKPAVSDALIRFREALNDAKIAVFNMGTGKAR